MGLGWYLTARIHRAPLTLSGRAAAKGLLVVTGAAVCCGPALLSTDAGLASAVRLVNSLSQDVHLSIESVSLGWTRPIEIRGVSVAERAEVWVGTGSTER